MCWWRRPRAWNIRGGAFPKAPPVQHIVNPALARVQAITHIRQTPEIAINSSRGRAGKRLCHAGRARRAKRTELLAHLDGLRDAAALDDSVALTLKERRCGLREKDKLLDTCRTGTPLELAHNALPETRATPISGDNDRSHERRRSKALEGTYALQTLTLIGDYELGVRGAKVARRKPVVLEERTNGARIARLSGK